MPPEPPAYTIESVDRALRLLVLLAERGVMTVSAAAAELGVARSSAHRLLATMQFHGFVRQDPLTKTYASGHQVLHVGLAAVENLDVRAVAGPHLDALQKQFDETVHLIILDGSLALFVDSRESSHTLRASSRRGASMPAYCTSGGKALLAQLTPEQLPDHLPVRLEPLSENSITRKADLRRELERIRETGYATNFEESEPELVAVGAAIPVAAHFHRAAIAIAGPRHRMSSERIEEMATAIGEHVRAIAAGSSAVPAPAVDGHPS